MSPLELPNQSTDAGHDLSEALQNYNESLYGATEYDPEFLEFYTYNFPKESADLTRLLKDHTDEGIDLSYNIQIKLAELDSFLDEYEALKAPESPLEREFSVKNLSDALNVYRNTHLQTPFYGENVLTQYAQAHPEDAAALNKALRVPVPYQADIDLGLFRLEAFFKEYCQVSVSPSPKSKEQVPLDAERSERLRIATEIAGEMRNLDFGEGVTAQLKVGPDHMPVVTVSNPELGEAGRLILRVDGAYAGAKTVWIIEGSGCRYSSSAYANEPFLSGLANAALDVRSFEKALATALKEGSTRLPQGVRTVEVYDFDSMQNSTKFKPDVPSYKESVPVIRSQDPEAFRQFADQRLLDALNKQRTDLVAGIPSLHGQTSEAEPEAFGTSPSEDLSSESTPDVSDVGPVSSDGEASIVEEEAGGEMADLESAGDSSEKASVQIESESDFVKDLEANPEKYVKKTENSDGSTSVELTEDVPVLESRIQHLVGPEGSGAATEIPAAEIGETVLRTEDGGEYRYKDGTWKNPEGKRLLVGAGYNTKFMISKKEVAVAGTPGTTETPVTTSAEGAQPATETTPGAAPSTTGAEAPVPNKDGKLKGQVDAQEALSQGALKEGVHILLDKAFLREGREERLTAKVDAVLRGKSYESLKFGVNEDSQQTVTLQLKDLITGKVYIYEGASTARIGVRLGDSEDIPDPFNKDKKMTLNVYRKQALRDLFVNVAKDKRAGGGSKEKKVA
ncbi:hypothetical protein IPG41_04720 [Candidatus Peregrinibacteria bacterium]|nr:MAG: hypothetical protein IPG41_04720 [Candidatus Peregrinibacteria bacterium]